MSQANVHSLVAMREFKVRLLQFADVTTEVVESLQQQVLTFLDWLEHFGHDAERSTCCGRVARPDHRECRGR